MIFCPGPARSSITERQGCLPLPGRGVACAGGVALCVVLRCAGRDFLHGPGRRTARRRVSDGTRTTRKGDGVPEAPRLRFALPKREGPGGGPLPSSASL